MNGEEVSGEEVQGKRTTKKCGLLGSYERTARNCCRVLTEQVAIDRAWFLSTADTRTEPGESLEEDSKKTRRGSKYSKVRL